MSDYLVHNTSRSIHTRTLRAAQPTHTGHKQFITSAQLRLVRARPLQITEEQLRDNLEELREKTGRGLLSVSTLDGRKIDLDTFIPEEAPLPPVKPHPPLDSVANDKQNVGEYMPKFHGGLAAPTEVPILTSTARSNIEELPVEMFSPTPEEVEHVERPSHPRRGRR